jgi:UDP-2-acetamido-2,6-beta-L-arabino-hexul-4-ose reductase
VKVLITGGHGFIGKNLQLHLKERKDIDILLFTRANSIAQLSDMVHKVNFVFHLAGINRPLDSAEFISGNEDLTRELCKAVATVYRLTGKKIPILYSSSVQAVADNLYGTSKRSAEKILLEFHNNFEIQVKIFRLPNVFGKWCKPNYNSVVATFCHNIANNLPIRINLSSAPISLVYIDDVIRSFVCLMDGANCDFDQNGFFSVTPVYNTTVGDLAKQIELFKLGRNQIKVERVGQGLTRALYSTFISYLPVESFTYPITQYSDSRGVFVEMLRTPDTGQISYFTAHPGITRGGHYHHSKTEKFLVVKGRACFRFQHMQTGVCHELVATGDKAQVVESIPGWAHDITNIGIEEMIVIIWANEVFDRAHPDTYTHPFVD